MLSIDLNCDCGESYGAFQIGDDEGILPFVSSANIACGGHAGDPIVMRHTVRRCRELGVAVGAHPSYPDLHGFGRRVLPMSPAEIEAWVLAQIGALAAIARAEGVELRHVKPHGALYNVAARDHVVATAVARAVAAFSHELALVGLADSALIDAGREMGLPVLAEAFADRAYEADGRLRDRRYPDALIIDPTACLKQTLSIVRDGVVIAIDGTPVPLQADTICVHGDTPGAAARAAALRHGLEAAGITVRTPR
ncbi:LamB/YcsF family protein [Chloroflexus aggregans]|uniref:5-oxoprolinase subunit A n=1 Tax=Chloroflexus aggregans (strain MD-66 / DSM 9485) TaxID=326427 RepID=PXPA_CHLAD|nr:5-oxoprolinase subunit PxpA [Chloroflexus aggregans]B8GBN6.1 RecName: Full=5-oxoprolinase subunit A; Short=5-OPase subunit A; AltName: Full=5-oxoprolinase (ATP-hydrolyzing) subunit A [Chloroflexus aggregans DSM 9485]ACL24853.1 LamB/YcsF family protein [Chloroflexus aggregans DSM 9485]